MFSLVPRELPDTGQGIGREPDLHRPAAIGQPHWATPLEWVIERVNHRRQDAHVTAAISNIKLAQIRSCSLASPAENRCCWGAP